MVRAKGRNHPYLELEREALDNHMMAMHGWSMQMVAVKGTQTLAQKYNYSGTCTAGNTPLRPMPCLWTRTDSRLSTRLPV
jgi:hypothetical protein